MAAVPVKPMSTKGCAQAEPALPTTISGGSTGCSRGSRLSPATWQLTPLACHMPRACESCVKGSGIDTWR